MGKARIERGFGRKLVGKGTDTGIVAQHHHQPEGGGMQHRQHRFGGGEVQCRHQAQIGLLARQFRRNARPGFLSTGGGRAQHLIRGIAARGQPDAEFGRSGNAARIQRTVDIFHQRVVVA